MSHVHIFIVLEQFCHELRLDKCLWYYFCFNNDIIKKPRCNILPLSQIKRRPRACPGDQCESKITQIPL
jgi:hypothetical protein